MREVTGQKCGSKFKNRKKKIKHRIGSIGNVRVQRYTGLICVEPSLAFPKIRLSNTHAHDDKFPNAHSVPLE